MQKAHSNVLLKLVLVVFIILLLLIPMVSITGLIHERQQRQATVEDEIQRSWAGQQTLAGPLLIVPFLRPRLDAKGIQRNFREHLVVLPDELEMEAEVVPEVRRRGLFSSIVYTTRVKVRSRFSPVDAERFHLRPDELLWQDAKLLFSVSELRGIASSPEWTWLGEPVEAEAEAPDAPWIHQALAVHRPTTIPLGGGEMALRLELRGSRQLDVLPLGRRTEVKLVSPWADPSFQGNFLPTGSQVTADGFTAQWSVPHFARRFPQTWSSEDPPASLEHGFAGASFGVVFLPALDFYQQVSRCTKYAILFIGLTFGLFALFELLNGLRIHPLQYLMVGSASSIFYLLLLSISEHLGFDTAYAIAALACCGLITAYSAKVLAARRRALVLGGTLTALYGTLYVLVQLETYALVLGSTLLFAVLGAVMFSTRNLDWYNLGRGRGPSGPPPVGPPPMGPPAVRSPSTEPLGV